MSDTEMIGGSAFSTFILVLYIVLKYPIKYGILFWLLMVMMTLFKMMYDNGCKGVIYVMRFFNTLLNPGEFDLIVFKLPNMFNIFMAFLDLFIGILYLSVACVVFILLGLVTLPFNLVFSL